MMQINSEVLNYGLELSLEWGENFMQPINERLMARYPQVSEEEAEAYDKLCREIKYYAFGQIEQAYINEVTWEQAKQDLLNKYPGLSEDSWQRLMQQGQYYAWRDHGDR